MAVPIYTYLKLKILGPCGIITVGDDLRQAHLYEWENCDITMAACQAPEPRPV